MDMYVSLNFKCAQSSDNVLLEGFEVFEVIFSVAFSLRVFFFLFRDA